MIGLTTAILLASAEPSTPYSGFESLKSRGHDATLCTADARICIATPESSLLTVTRDGKEIARWAPDTEGGDLSFSPMPALLRLSGGRLLVGALGTRSTSYSGGGGSATEQVLVLVEPDKAAKPVLSLPESGSLMIRACFTEQDFKRRAGACHAEFRFSATLEATTAIAGTLPVLHFRMVASHYPRGASRDGDSLSDRPLRRADLTWQTDTRCTFERTFSFDVSSERYVESAALPDCTDYVVP